MVGDPYFVLDRRFFFLLILDRLRENKQKIKVGSLKFPHFSARATSNPATLRLSGLANSIRNPLIDLIDSLILKFSIESSILEIYLQYF